MSLLRVLPPFPACSIARYWVNGLCSGPDHPVPTTTPACESARHGSDEDQVPDRQCEERAGAGDLQERSERSSSRWFRLVVVYNRYEVPQELFVEERKAAFKVDFLSSLFNHYVIGYERKWKKTNLEFKAGYIGPGISTAIREGRGYIVKAGIKFVWPRSRS